MLNFAKKHMIAEDKKTKMFSMVELWRKSTLTRNEFAMENGIKPTSFDYWCRKQFNEVEKAAKPTFIEIGHRSVLSVDKKEPQVEMEFPSGLRLKIY
jgi:hypothetical protein